MVRKTIEKKLEGIRQNFSIKKSDIWKLVENYKK